MNKKDREHWKAKLTEERKKLTDQLRNVEEGILNRSQRDASGDPSGHSTHMAEAGTENFERDITLAHASNGQNTVFEIDEALKRIEEGTFGNCESCAKPIRKERLKAVPYAHLCISCQSNEEARPRPGGQ